MPIANCIITSECQESKYNLIDCWASESGQSSEHMTVNIITSTQQLGKKYSAMATLFLPSLWSDSAVSSLQIGLAKALAKTYGLSLDDVNVITSIVGSGFVVESGKQEKW